jgi:hypothetical protein
MPSLEYRSMQKQNLYNILSSKGLREAASKAKVSMEPEDVALVLKQLEEDIDKGILKQDETNI